MIHNGSVRIRVSLRTLSVDEICDRIGFRIDGIGPGWLSIISDMIRQLDASPVRDLWVIRGVESDGAGLNIDCRLLGNDQNTDVGGLNDQMMQMVYAAAMRTHLICERCGAIRTPCQPGSTTLSCSAGCGYDPYGHRLGGLHVSQTLWDRVIGQMELEHDPQW